MGGPGRLVIRPPQGRGGELGWIRAELLKQLQAIEGKLSRYLDNSVISLINQRAGSGTYTPIDDEVAGLLQLCHQLWLESDGAFDATAGILRKAWRFGEDPRAMPEKLPQLMPLVDWQGVDIGDAGVHLQRAGMELDLGGIGKEYAVDVGVRWLLSEGIEHCVLELAGDVRACGYRAEGQPWQVGIRDPQAADDSIASVVLLDAAMATSGTTQRRLHYAGRSYSHLLDARSGWPVEGVASVSVISEDCITAGAVATLACLRPAETADRWLASTDLPWLRVTSDGVRSGPLAESSIEVDRA